MPRTRSAPKQVRLQTLQEMPGPGPIDLSAPGLSLMGLGYMMVEMADQALARDDLEGARSLVELTMSTFHTAHRLDATLQSAHDHARLRLERTMHALQRATGAGDDASDSDPEDRWPNRII